MLERQHQDGLHTGRLKKLLDMMLTPLPRYPRCSPSVRLSALVAFFRVFVCLHDTGSLHPLSIHSLVPITPAMYRLGDRTPILHASDRLGAQGLAQIVCECQRAFRSVVIKFLMFTIVITVNPHTKTWLWRPRTFFTHCHRLGARESRSRHWSQLGQMRTGDHKAICIGLALDQQGNLCFAALGQILSKPMTPQFMPKISQIAFRIRFAVS